MSSPAGGPTPQDAPYGALPQDHAPVPPPPGWYPDGSGGLRWWDGRAWSSATAPAPEPDRTWVVLAHLSLLVAPIVGALVLRLTVGRQDALTRHHTSEALNAQITWTVLLDVVGIAGVVSTAGWAPGPGRGLDLPGGFLVAWAVCGVGVLLLVGCAVAGAVSASRGEWFRYPLSVRVVRGGRRRPRPVQLPR